MSKLGYIPEIDGLRSVAVIPVILYHLGFAWIPGGFLGVDVFFVISGYLITAILLRETEKPRKAYFYDFYLRRMRRIFPVFFTVILATLCAGYFLLLPSDYLELGKSAVASVGFVSNIYFYLNTGYFDLSAESMPLLHTWSLAVEEQFYIIWPALILLLSRLSGAVKWRTVLGIFFCSFLLSIFITPLNPSLAFYNLPFRIFQFFLGAMIPLFLFETAIYKRNWPFGSLLLQIVGFSIIVFSIFYFSSEDAFPGWLALWPAVGASLFIVGATMKNKPHFNPMKSKLVVGIGKISFSLYLWHWPVVTLYKAYTNSTKISAESAIWLLLITLALSIASYYLIEKPFRKPAWQPKASMFSVATAAGVVCFFFFIIQTGGFSHRIPNAEKFASLKEMWKWDCSEIKILGKAYCNFGEPWETSQRKVVLWGDSHAEHIAPLLEMVAAEHNLSIVLFKSCRPLTDGVTIQIRHKNPSRATEGCFASSLRALELIKNDPEIALVIITGSWQYSLNQMFSRNNERPNISERLMLMKSGLSFTVENILELGPKVLLLGDTPHPGEKRSECADQNDLFRKSKPDCLPISFEELQVKHKLTEDIILEVADYYDNVFFHSIIKNYCVRGVGCSLYSKGEYIFRDDSHIRRNYSDEIKMDLILSFGLLQEIDWMKLTSSNSAAPD
ncbi:MAG: acyltransferase [Xanthomonadales bacterium]|nr:acyltransferase [Xanthomonadales bacterium]